MRVMGGRGPFLASQAASHLDSQLEDNISRRGRVRYKYFLRGDNSLLATHRWGQNLVSSPGDPSFPFYPSSAGP